MVVGCTPLLQHNLILETWVCRSFVATFFPGLRPSQMMVKDKRRSQTLAVVESTRVSVELKTPLPCVRRSRGSDLPQMVSVDRRS